MPSVSPAPAGLPFFLPAVPGQRFCIYYAPAPGPCRAALLYVPPFGEEMNRSRRMAAMQARMLASAGVAVLMIDLYGCGDSSGDFVDARWEIWRDDLALAHAWLAGISGLAVGLWGLRLGALLALDYARLAPLPVERFILWQPVTRGDTFMTQFLRLQLATAMLAEQEDAGTAAGGTQAMRARLQTGATLEVAGYELAPALVQAIDAVDATTLAPYGIAVSWIDIVSQSAPSLPPTRQNLVSGWQRNGVPVQLQCVPGLPFWATADITTCAALLAATLTHLAMPAA